MLRHCDGDGAFVEQLVVRILQPEQNLMRPRRQAIDDHRIAAGVHPYPWEIVKTYVEVPDAGMNPNGGRSEHGRQLQILRAIADNDAAL
jgi:hypothetical protein